MSEYWKSTPKYWCKFCKVYVRDTKFEKQAHDATGRHQGAIQRSLRDLHKGQEREERDKQRAKDEVARLNGIVPGPGGSSSKDPPWKKQESTSAPSKVATIEERKRQMAQLAEMGIAVPEAFQKEMAMAGEWKAVETAPVKHENKDANGVLLNKGIHKRKLDGDEEEQEAAAVITKKKGWGNTYKSFPGKGGGGGEDFDILFQTKKPASKKEGGEDEGHEVKAEEAAKLESDVKSEHVEGILQDIPTAAEASATTAVKTEHDIPVSPAGATAQPAETEKTAGAPAVVFKKRKKAGR